MSSWKESSNKRQAESREDTLAYGNLNEGVNWISLMTLLKDSNTISCLLRADELDGKNDRLLNIKYRCSC